MGQEVGTSFKQWADDVPDISWFWRLNWEKKSGISYALGLQVPEKLLQLLDAFSCRVPVREMYPELLIHEPLGNWWNCYPLNRLWQTAVLNSEMHRSCVLIMGDRKGPKGVGKETSPLFSCPLEPCSFDGHVFQDGEGWSLGRCSRCVCRDGAAQCSTASCQPLLCSQVRTLQPSRNVPQHPLFHGQCAFLMVGSKLASKASGWQVGDLEKRYLTGRNGVEWWWSLCVSSLIASFPSIF